MKETKLIRSVLAALAVLVSVVLVSCGAFFENEQSGNVTINIPPISAGRAISLDKISDLKIVTTSYRVTANGITREGTGGTYTFRLPVGVVAKITVECLNSSGDVIVRAKKTHKVKAGTNNVNINLLQDGEVMGTGGGPAAPQPSYRELSTAQVGDVICANGKVLSASDITPELQSQTIAVVYKVDSNARKVWAVGKVLSSSSMKWADSSADGYQNITALQEENGYTDGSTGLEKLRAAVSDADGDDLATNYPPWDYACNYGIKQGLTSFQTGWYLPSKQELQEVYDNRSAIDTALAKTGVSKTSFGSSYYWSSSQYATQNTHAYSLVFSNGNWDSGFGKISSSYVCAVRQFTY